VRDVRHRGRLPAALPPSSVVKKEKRKKEREVILTLSFRSPSCKGKKREIRPRLLVIGADTALLVTRRTVRKKKERKRSIHLRRRGGKKRKSDCRPRSARCRRASPLPTVVPEGGRSRETNPGTLRVVCDGREGGRKKNQRSNGAGRGSFRTCSSRPSTGPREKGQGRETADDRRVSASCHALATRGKKERKKKRRKREEGMDFCIARSLGDPGQEKGERAVPLSPLAGQGRDGGRKKKKGKGKED